MFRQLDDFIRAHHIVAENTLKILRTLTDESLTRPVTDGYRTLGGMAWHLVTTVPEIMTRTGLPIDGVQPEALPPDTVREIIAGYQAVTDALTGALRTHWTDPDLTTTDTMYGEEWPRGVTLMILLHHEIHHRGQMTVLMRQAGLQVPGILGPAKEEWSQYGMPAPPY